MAYDLAITPKEGFLHVTVTGQNSMEAVNGYIVEVIRECAARHCRRVLIEECLLGPRLGTVDVFNLVSGVMLRSRGELHSIAFVDVNASGDTMHFAEDVAVNRGAPFRVFPNVAAAEQWLLAEIARSAAVPHSTRR